MYKEAQSLVEKPLRRQKPRKDKKKKGSSKGKRERWPNKTDCLEEMNIATLA